MLQLLEKFQKYARCNSNVNMRSFIKRGISLSKKIVLFVSIKDF